MAHFTNVCILTQRHHQRHRWHHFVKLSSQFISHLSSSQSLFWNCGTSIRGLCYNDVLLHLKWVREQSWEWLEQVSNGFNISKWYPVLFLAQQRSRETVAIQFARICLPGHFYGSCIWVLVDLVAISLKERMQLFTLRETKPGELQSEFITAVTLGLVPGPLAHVQIGEGHDQKWKKIKLQFLKASRSRPKDQLSIQLYLI